MNTAAVVASSLITNTVPTSLLSLPGAVASEAASEAPGFADVNMVSFVLFVMRDGVCAQRWLLALVAIFLRRPILRIL